MTSGRISARRTVSPPPRPRRIVSWSSVPGLPPGTPGCRPPAPPAAPAWASSISASLFWRGSHPRHHRHERQDHAHRISHPCARRRGRGRLWRRQHRLSLQPADHLQTRRRDGFDRGVRGEFVPSRDAAAFPGRRRALDQFCRGSPGTAPGAAGLFPGQVEFAGAHAARRGVRRQQRAAVCARVRPDPAGRGRRGQRGRGPRSAAPGHRFRHLPAARKLPAGPGLVAARRPAGVPALRRRAHLQARPAPARAGAGGRGG